MRANWLVKMQAGSNEFIFIRRLYGILFFQIVISVFYPDILYDKDSILPFLDRNIRGVMLLILAWRAATFQLSELAIFPEGRSGRVYSLLLPMAFIVANWMAFQSTTAPFWLFFVAFVTFLYALKPLVLWRNNQTNTYFVLTSKSEILWRLLKTWRRNVSYLAGVFGCFAFIRLFAPSPGRFEGLSPDISRHIPTVLDILILVITILLLRYHMRREEPLDARAALDQLESALKPDKEPEFHPSIVDYFVSKDDSNDEKP